MSEVEMGDTSSSDGAAEQETITLTIKRLVEPPFTVTVPFDASIAVLREMVERESNVPRARIRLIYQGRVLRDDSTVRQSGLQNGFALHFVVVDSERQQQQRQQQQQPAQQQPQRPPPPAGTVPSPAAFMGLQVDSPEIAANIGQMMATMVNSLTQHLAGAGRPPQAGQQQQSAAGGPVPHAPHVHPPHHHHHHHHPQQPGQPGQHGPHGVMGAHQGARPMPDAAMQPRMIALELAHLRAAQDALLRAVDHNVPLENVIVRRQQVNAPTEPSAALTFFNERLRLHADLSRRVAEEHAQVADMVARLPSVSDAAERERMQARVTRLSIIDRVNAEASTRLAHLTRMLQVSGGTATLTWVPPQGRAVHAPAVPATAEPQAAAAPAADATELAQLRQRLDSIEASQSATESMLRALTEHLLPQRSAPAASAANAALPAASGTTFQDAVSADVPTSTLIGREPEPTPRVSMPAVDAAMLHAEPWLNQVPEAERPFWAATVAHDSAAPPPQIRASQAYQRSAPSSRKRKAYQQQEAAMASPQSLLSTLLAPSADRPAMPTFSDDTRRSLEEALARTARHDMVAHARERGADISVARYPNLIATMQAEDAVASSSSAPSRQ